MYFLVLFPVIYIYIYIYIYIFFFFFFILLYVYVAVQSILEWDKGGDVITKEKEENKFEVESVQEKAIRTVVETGAKKTGASLEETVAEVAQAEARGAR